MAYLRELGTDVPAWLSRFSAETGFKRDEFFSGRVVVYPGAGTDGHPVRVFGSAHAAHSFVYVDYHLSEEQLRQELASRAGGFRGYECLAVESVTEQQLCPEGWTQHYTPPVQVGAQSSSRGRGSTEPYALFVVLERSEDFTDEHGPARLALLYIGGDGHATFDALFCQESGPANPFAVLLQDHGFGGDYSSWGGAGVMARLARRHKAEPRFLLVAEGTRPWRGFVEVPGLRPDGGGMYQTPRRLFQRV